MNYRLLGKTGLSVSEIGFGCGSIGGLMIRAPFEERVRAVKLAYDLGINYFDTAAAYGEGQSEKNLGEVLGFLKLNPVVATKFSLGPPDKLDIKGAIARSLENSLKSLNKDFVDIFQLHTPVVEKESDNSRGIGLDRVLGPGGVADALDDLRSQGLVHFAGFTGLGETPAIHRMVESRRFDLVQSYYNLLNPSAGRSLPSEFKGQDFGNYLEKASCAGMGVAAIRVLAGGALGGVVSRKGYASPSVGGALVGGADYAVDSDKADKIAATFTGRPGNLSQAAIRFALDHPAVSTVIIGFSNLAQIEEAVSSTNAAPLSNSELAYLDKQWATNFGI